MKLVARHAANVVGADVVGARGGGGVLDGGVTPLAGVGRAVGRATLGDLARVTRALRHRGISDGSQAARATDGVAVQGVVVYICDEGIAEVIAVVPYSIHGKFKKVAVLTSVGMTRTATADLCEGRAKDNIRLAQIFRYWEQLPRQ